MIELRGLCKTYVTPAGPLRANDGVSLRVADGSIHGLIGENGAGKSTAMKLLYGMERPDSGEILLSGKRVAFRSPSDAKANGIGMVHQHFMLSGPETPLDNVILGDEPGVGGSGMGRWIVDRKKALAELTALSDRYRMPVPWLAATESLPVGVQQRIEILKLLHRNARVLILDEPTAVLSPGEIQELFEQLRRLRDEGRVIVLITHKLKEVMAITDHVTVMRQGKVVADFVTREASIDQFSEAMVGRRLTGTPHVGGAAESATGHSKSEAPPALEIKLRKPAAPVTVDVRVAAGEIVGIAGVDGNGQSEWFRAMTDPAGLGASPNRSASVYRVGGLDLVGQSTRAVRESGVAIIPEDRHEEALALDASLTENFLLAHAGESRFVSGPGGRFVDWTQVRAAARAGLERFDVRPRDTEATAGGLSGGNQQKWVFARELDRPSEGLRLLLVSQPTRGVDIGAIERIHAEIRQVARNGAGVLLVSSELDEVLALSDRVLVMSRGVIAGEFKAPFGAEQVAAIGLAMGGVRA